jgi:hypothetical protein
MVSLLVLSMVLSAPADAAQDSVFASDPLVASTPQTVLNVPESFVMTEGNPSGSLDLMQLRPESGICYKIRAFIFSQNSHPKLLRETTCGPKAPAAKSIEGARPKLLPLDAKDTPTE